MKKMIYLAFFLMLAFNTSCLKKQNLEEVSLGPQFATEDLSKVMLDGFGPLDYGSIKKNEFSSYVLTQRIQDSYLQTLEQQDMTIKDSVLSQQGLSLDSVVTKIKYSGGQTAQSTREWHRDFPFADIQTLADNDPPTYLFLYFQLLAFQSCLPEGDAAETCHGLAVTDFKFRVPQTAASQHDCAPEQDCFINARKIEYDTLSTSQLDKDGKPRRTHFTFILSKEVPFLSRILQFCQRSLYEVSNSNQKVLVDYCYDINNYAFGNP